MALSSYINTTYCGAAPAPQQLWQAWNTDWRLLLVLAALLALGSAVPAGRQRRRFLAGWCALVVAFVSPLCAWTVALVSARAVHHLLLLTVAAPCLAAVLPGRWLRATGPWPLLVTLLVLVLWHVPAVYAWVWSSSRAYWLGQAALLLPAMVFWGSVFAPWQRGAVHTAGVLPALSQLAALAGVMGLLGAVLSFAPQVLYPQHGMAPLLYGLQPLQDQQLAGLLMWVPGFVPLAAIAGALLHRAWLQAQPVGAPSAGASAA